MSSLSPRLLDDFALASTDLLASRALLRRTDTKYLFAASTLDPIIAAIRPDYALLPSRAVLIPEYHTIYFDTPDLQCFHDHRRGRRLRHKVRIRHYPQRGVSFLEIKTKLTERVTRKHRLERAYGDNELTDADRAFVALHTGLPVEQLEPTARTDFRRLTLLGIRTHERVTIDIDLRVGATVADRPLPGVAIVEVKQSPYSPRTPIMQALRRAGHRPEPASKYCAATILTGRAARFNRLIPVLRAMERCAL